jgi:PDDEXK-like domain of unknown function (DUF3799)
MSSQVKRPLISPAHYLCELNDAGEATEAMLYGAVLHARLLEPDTFDAHYYAMPKIDRRTKEGKAPERHEARSAGRAAFPAEWLSDIERTLANARVHRRAAKILSAGEAEVTLAWIDPDTGIKCKSRIDWWHDTTLLLDVKSAHDVTAAGFSRACAQLKYALSAFMYCEGVRQVTGERPNWAFMACERAQPNMVPIYRASDAFMRRGKCEFRRALDALAECRATGCYPMMQADGEWEVIDLPRWA